MGRAEVTTGTCLVESLPIDSAVMKPIDAHVRRLVAVESGRHERTIERFLAGEPVRPSSAAQIRAALERMGLGEAVRDRPEQQEGT